MTSSDKLLKRYEAIPNEIEDGVGETDLKGNLTYINDAGCRNWGYPREELIGSSYKAYVDEEGAQLLLEVYNTVYTTGQPIRFVHHVIRKTVCASWWRMPYRPFAGKTGPLSASVPSSGM